ncbi:unannotated protein [freshwater metagenome]|uniref:Unannotated protein n=1 Tax=freshwater metagenome TaxID=449393 RepID=A0A6J6YA93_9ZZZZ
MMPTRGIALIRGNQVARAIASIISGVTKIKNTVAIKNFVQLPGLRAKATPDMPPITTAITVAPNAAMNEFRIESPIPAKSKIVRYHSVINPLRITANTNDNGITSDRTLFENLSRRRLMRTKISAANITTANRISNATITPPLNSSPHHFVLALPDQIVNEPP